MDIIYFLSILLSLLCGIVIGRFYGRNSNNQKNIKDVLENRQHSVSPTLFKEPIRKNTEHEVAEAVESERLRIKLALHDDTVQRIVAVKLKVESLLLVPSLIKQDQVEIVLSDFESTVISLHYLIANLVDERFEQKTISELINELKSRFSRFLMIRVLVYENNPENTFALSTLQKIELFYIVQESLQNSIKYSHSGQFHIHLIWRSEEFILETEDGAWAINRYATKGHGIRSMKERAESIGATFYFGLVQNKGVLVRVVLPKLQQAVSE